MNQCVTAICFTFINTGSLFDIFWAMSQLIFNMLTLRLGLPLLCLFASNANGSIQPWLNTSLPTEDRLQSFLSQLSIAQKFNMTQGAQSVCPQSKHTGQLLTHHSSKQTNALDMSQETQPWAYPPSAWAMAQPELEMI